MIYRTYTRCPGCDCAIVLRLSIGFGKRQPILAHCPQCDAAIRGVLTANQEAGVVSGVELEHGALFGSELEQEPGLQTVTIHPDLPHDPTLEQASPFLEAVTVFGDTFGPAMRATGQFLGLVESLWPEVERSYGYYLREDWGHFDDSMRRALGDGWTASSTPTDRHDRVHRLLSVILMPLAADAAFPDMKAEVWASAQVNVAALGEFVRDPKNSHDIKVVQRRIFEQIRRMIEIRDAWRPAIGMAHLLKSGIDVPPGWRLPGDYVHILRDAYRQNYELACQGIFMLVGLKNIQDERAGKTICEPDYSSGWVPDYRNVKALPRTVQQLKSKSAEIKELYLDAFPGVARVWKDVYDRRTRNFIAHADVELDRDSGSLVLGQDKLGYIEFVSSTIAQLQLLMLLLDLAKLLRIVGDSQV